MTDLTHPPFDHCGARPDEGARRPLGSSFGKEALSIPAERDHLHFARLWSHAQLPVRAYFNSFLSDHSGIDDCVQEVALVAWKKAPLDQDANSFVAYCVACSKKIAQAEVRKKYRSRLHPLSPETLSQLADAAAAIEHESSLSSSHRLSALRVCLDSLPAAPRRLLNLRYTSGDRSALQREAATTGKSLDAIYKTLERLRALLKACVSRKYSPGE